MGAESDEALAAIVQRKEYERQLGDGLFAWGIGNALGNAVASLAADRGEPLVVFSPMVSKAKKGDSNPSSLLLWTTYEDAHGAVHPLPSHLVVTSRGHAGEDQKTRHYALICRSDTPLSVIATNECVVPAEYRNFGTGNPLGASQVTAVVRHKGDAPTGSRSYPVAFLASLIDAMYVRLLAPRILSRNEASDMTMAASGLDTWAPFVKRIRQGEINFELLARGDGRYPNYG